KDTKPTYTAPTNPYANFTAPEYTAMTYDTAKTQAGDRINPEYAMKLQDALNNVKNQSMGSGFFGQLPQLQVSADESARNENQRAIAIADMARQLQADDESKYDKLYDRAFNMWRSNRSDFDADRQFGYGQYRDNVGDWDSNRDFAWGQYQDKKDTAYKDYGIKNDNYQWKTTYDRGVLESDRDFKLAQEKVGSSGGGGGGGGGRRKSSGGSSSKTNSGKSKSTKTKATTTKTVKQYPSVKEMTKARDDSLKKVLGWKW
ncbi:MAG TPA: hypothetical protein VEA37_01210, partial [Flavobacterium sp.]|nr:hypothetical protein [Flavobacterium sp.]